MDNITPSQIKSFTSEIINNPEKLEEYMEKMKEYLEIIKIKMIKKLEEQDADKLIENEKDL